MVIESEANIFQRHLIPEESRLVRYSMQQAGIYGSRTNVFYAHFVSVGFATTAVAMSFFNAISYFLQIPFRIVLKMVQFNPPGAAIALVEDATNVVKSLVFVSLGATFITAGLLSPKAIFTHFAPEYYDTLEERLKQENSLNQKKIARLEEELSKANQSLDRASFKLEEQRKELDALKRSTRRTWWRFC